MRRIEPTTQFRKDYKREAKGPFRAQLDDLLTPIVRKLASDLPLEAKHHDHPLSGEWKDHRDCHIKPNLILIYRKPKDSLLQLVRLGSHSELGL